MYTEENKNKKKHYLLVRPREEEGQRLNISMKRGMNICPVRHCRRQSSVYPYPQCILFATIVYKSMPSLSTSHPELTVLDIHKHRAGFAISSSPIDHGRPFNSDKNC